MGGGVVWVVVSCGWWRRVGDGTVWGVGGGGHVHAMALASYTVLHSVTQ